MKGTFLLLFLPRVEWLERRRFMELMRVLSAFIRDVYHATTAAIRVCVACKQAFKSSPLFEEWKKSQTKTTNYEEFFQVKEKDHFFQDFQRENHFFDPFF